MKSILCFTKLCVVLSFVIVSGKCLVVQNNPVKFIQEQIKPGSRINFSFFSEINQQSNKKDFNWIPRYQREQSELELIETCGGVFKKHQTIITSPNYPNNYPSNVQCLYIFKSPFLCRNEFHIQFLDFHLESSKNCKKDSFIINGTDIFCGQVIGIRTYNTSKGILTIEFHSNEKIERSGFKLLITRLPCEQMISQNEFEVIELSNSSKKVDVRNVLKPTMTNHQSQSPTYVNNNKQYLPPLGYLPSIPSYSPSADPNTRYFPQNQPCIPIFSNPNNNYPVRPPIPMDILPPVANEITPQSGYNLTIYSTPKVESGMASWLSSTIPSCCARSFRGKRFYLSTPGFPASTISYPRDCLYYIEKFGPNVCRLRIEFKFFFMGNDPLRCQDDFVEIDNQRICGCRTGLVYTSQWGVGSKVVRLRMSGKHYSHNTGFIIDIIQEDCPYRYSTNTSTTGTPQRKTDIPSIGKVIVETNSTTRTNYYFTDIPQSQQVLETRERPSSQFFFLGSNIQNSCVFTLADYIRLSVESLWIHKPDCVAPR